MGLNPTDSLSSRHSIHSHFPPLLFGSFHPSFLLLLSILPILVVSLLCSLFSLLYPLICNTFLYILCTSISNLTMLVSVPQDTNTSNIRRRCRRTRCDQRNKQFQRYSLRGLLQCEHGVDSDRRQLTAWRGGGQGSDHA